jgi:hypothetical protein
MTGDHHGQAAGMASLLVRAVDGILGTHKGSERGFKESSQQCRQIGSFLVNHTRRPARAGVPRWGRGQALCLARRGRGQLTLHLPQYWHRQSEWLALFEAACGPPARAA